MTYFGDTWRNPAPSHPPQTGAQPWPPHPAPHPRGAREAGPGQPFPHNRPHQSPGAYGPDLRTLRSAYRRLRRISTLTALGNFAVYVVLSCYAEDLMESRITGDLTLGVVLGLLQLVVTFGAIRWYERGARRSVDRLALRIREQIGRQNGEARAAR